MTRPMATGLAWVRLLTSLSSDPRVLAAGDPAFGLYCRGLCYAGSVLSDGFVPRAFVRGQKDKIRAKTLVRVKLWAIAKRGWTIVDYLATNESRSDIVRSRISNVERQRRFRESQDHGGRDGDRNAATNASITRYPTLLSSVRDTLLSSPLERDREGREKRNDRETSPPPEELRAVELWLTQGVVPEGMTEAQARAKHGPPLGEEASRGTETDETRPGPAEGERG